MKTLKQLKAGLLAAAVFLSASDLCAEVVTWSGTAQSVSANTEIEALHVTANTTVTIAGGCSLTVDELIGDAAITKAGDGTLVVKSFSANSQITATAGSVRFAAGGPTDTTVFDSANTFYHVDASVASSLTTAGTDAEGRTLVSTLADIRGAGYPTSNNKGYAADIADYNMPWVEKGFLNGRDVLDFGTLRTASAEGYGAALVWDTISTGIKEVLIVYSDAHDAQNQFLLGCKWPGNRPGYNAYTYHYCRAGAALFHQSYAHTNVLTGSIYVDGVSRAYNYALPAGFHVIRLVQAGPTTASAFADDRHDTRGGMRLAEAIVLNANLDALSSRRLEMRLQQKWVPSARTIAALSLSGTANLTVDAGVKFRVIGGSLAATATVTGDGEAQFEVSEGGYSLPAKSIVKVTDSSRSYRATPARRVRVEQGLLQIATPVAKLTPALHLDAVNESSFTFAGGGVQYWNDLRGYQTGQARQFTDVQRPMRVSNVQNGLPVVDFGDIYANGHWAEANAPRWLQMVSEVSNIFDVFMVVCDTDEARQYALSVQGQFLLGHSSVYDFHRGGGVSILRTDKYGCGKDPQTTTELDGASCTKDAALSEGFHLVRISPQNAAKFDQICKERSNCYGGLKYGEILVYTGAKLSDAEAADVSSYLLNKWGLPNASGKGVAYESISIMKNATFAPSKFSSTFALDGAGTVQGDLALEEGFTLKVTAGEPLAVTGKLTLPATGTIEISGNVKDFGCDAVVTLVSAGSTVVAENPTWTVTGSFTDSRRAIEVFADAEGLKAKIIPPGLTIILR